MRFPQIKFYCPVIQKLRSQHAQPRTLPFPQTPALHTPTHYFLSVVQQLSQTTWSILSVFTARKLATEADHLGYSILPTFLHWETINSDLQGICRPHTVLSWVNSRIFFFHFEVKNILIIIYRLEWFSHRQLLCRSTLCEKETKNIFLDSS